MRKPRILVTSAAGRTGSVTVHQLLEAGFPVRAFVRRDDARAQRLREAGAEIFVGNLFDMRDLRRALAGVQRAFYCPPFAPNLLHGSMLFAMAAEEAKLEVVALMSQWNPHESHPSANTREHWITNNVFQWMPSVDVVYVNPGLFAFMYFLGLPALVHLGLLALPYGDGLNAPPSALDIGRVAAGVLAAPREHVGKHYRPTGPKLLAPRDIARILGDVLGRTVTHKDVSTNMFVKAARAQGLVTEFELASIRHYAEDLRGGTFAFGAPTDHVEQVTGTPAESFETTARRYLAQPHLIAPGLEPGSFLGALWFGVKMLLAPSGGFDRWESDQHLPRIDRPLLAYENPAWRSAAGNQRLLISATSQQGAAERTPSALEQLV